MDRTLLSVITLIVVAVASVTTSSALISQQNVSSSQGAIQTTVGVEVYTNAQATVLCASIDWGLIEEGVGVTRVIYVKNTAENAETLRLYTNNWVPAEAETLMDVTWDKEGTLIQAGQVISAAITLLPSVDMQAVDSFNFNILIESSV